MNLHFFSRVPSSYWITVSSLKIVKVVEIPTGVLALFRGTQLDSFCAGFLRWRRRKFGLAGCFFGFARRRRWCWLCGGTCASGLQEKLASFLDESPSAAVLVVLGLRLACGARRSSGSGLGFGAPHFLQSLLSSFQKCLSVQGSFGWLRANRGPWTRRSWGFGSCLTTWCLFRNICCGLGRLAFLSTL